MGAEISDGAKLGIMLIALAAVIGLGFSIFSTAKGTADDGSVKLQDKLGAVSSSDYLSFDQKIVTGTQVMGALSDFAGKNVAVAVSTKAFNSGVAGFIHPGGAAALMYTAAVADASTLQAFQSNGTTALTVIPNSGGAAVNLVFINYNALFTASEKLVLNNGVYEVAGGFAVDGSGSVTFNNLTAGLSKSGNGEYVPSSARFQANLIKDKGGTVVGVAFQQK